MELRSISSVIPHFFKRLPDGLLLGDVLNEALGNHKAQNVHSVSSRFSFIYSVMPSPRIAAPITVAKLEYLGVTNFTP